MFPCCEITTEIDKYSTPSVYGNDRYERFAYMRLYSMHKRDYAIVSAIFLICFGLCLLIGSFGPSIVSTMEVNSYSLLPASTTNVVDSLMAKGPIVLTTPKLFSYSQQLWLIIKFQIRNIEDELITKMFYVSLVVEGIDENRNLFTVYDNKNTQNRSRNLHCQKAECSEFAVLHFGAIFYTQYIISIRFFGLEAFHQRYKFEKLIFYFRTYNPAFTQFEVGFRFIFLLSTLVVTLWFSLKVQWFAAYDWSIEQKWTSVLLSLLIFFNNPLFPLNFIVNSWIPGLFNAIAQGTFLCACLLFWLCLYHELRRTEKKLLLYYAPKVFIVFMIWISIVITAVWKNYNALQDPSFNLTTDSSDYYIVKAFLLIFGFIYLGYLLFLMIKAYLALRHNPFFRLRLQFLSMLILLVFGIVFAVTMLRFGIDVIEDEFVNRLSTYYRSSTEFMALYGLVNLYIYTIAYIYSPINKPIHEFHMTRDNQTLLLDYDSDEEVIYGLDAESRKPLRMLGDVDDSD